MTILKCSCEHVAQDEFHGSGRRVHNAGTVKEDGRRVYRCTVCGREQEKKDQ